jgi:hypothetical protein
MKKRISLKRRTKHSTESEDGSQGVGGTWIKYKRRPPRKTIRGANNESQKAADTKASGRASSALQGLRSHLKVAATGIVESVCGGAGGDWVGFADGVTVDDEFDAAIALAAFGSVVGRHGLRLAEAAGGHSAAGNAFFG